MTRRDVVIIGGSLAGSACARELQRLGVDAVAFERERFPREKVCGGFLSPGAVACIHALGLLDAVQQAGAVQVKSARVRASGIESAIPFERSGLGISRGVLDEILAAQAPVIHGHPVRDVRRCGSAFVVDGTYCKVVIDAAGKLSRFTNRIQVDEFGIQFFRSDQRGSVLDFWFLDDGYGGAVSVEGGRSNFCFLVKKQAVQRYLEHYDCLVTGPLAYECAPSDFIAIGDAAGMVDPFCGEGMRHALDTGILAARVVAGGIRHGRCYEEMKVEYDAERERRWAWKRALGGIARRLQSSFGVGLRVAPAWLVNRIWD
jgi:flavin-dependent dehydrogenase